MDFIRNPFRLPVGNVPDEFSEPKTVRSNEKYVFDEKSLTGFRPLMINSYPIVTEKALRALIPFCGYASPRVWFFHIFCGG